MIHQSGFWTITVIEEVNILRYFKGRLTLDFTLKTTTSESATGLMNQKGHFYVVYVSVSQSVVWCTNDNMQAASGATPLHFLSVTFRQNLTKVFVLFLSSFRIALIMSNVKCFR